MDSELRNLRKNTIIIAIANIGSKGITFILAPLFSYFMSTSEYGTMDIISTTVCLLFPIMCFDIYEATFRYSSDGLYNNKKVLNTSLINCIPVCVLCFLVVPISCIKNLNPNLFVTIPVCVCLYALTSVFAQYLRGKQKIKLFAFSGMVSALSMLVFSAILILGFKMGLTGWVWATCLSKMLEFVYLLLADHNYKDINLKEFDSNYLKEFVKFSLPLMPTTIMWWIMNMSDRYMLAGLLSMSATGIYAVATKIPSILSVFENIFYQAWHTTAINKSEDKQRDSIFSVVFQNYMTIMIIGLLGLLVVSKPLVLGFFADEYHEAWRYLPPLILGVVVHALSGNLGSLYAVFKDTKGALISTVLGAIVNIAMNLLIIPFGGIMGAALTTLLGYFVTLVYRWFDTKRFVRISMEKKEVFLLSLVAVIQIVLYYIDGVYSYGIRIIILFVSIVWKHELIKSILKR